MWNKIDDNILGHRKTTILARALRIDEYAAVGVLVCLWNWALRYAPDGDITDYPIGDIAKAIKYPKQAGRLLSALLEAGFLDLEQERFVLHDWEDYGGKWYQQTEANRRRNRSRPAQSLCKDFAVREEEEKKREEESRAEQKEARAVQLFKANTDGRYVTERVCEEIQKWCRQVGEELVCACVLDVAKSGRKPWTYVEKRLEEWERMGFRSQADVDQYYARRRRKASGDLNYNERTADKLEALFEKL